MREREKERKRERCEMNEIGMPPIQYLQQIPLYMHRSRLEQSYYECFLLVSFEERPSLSGRWRTYISMYAHRIDGGVGQSCPKAHNGCQMYQRYNNNPTPFVRDV